MKRQNQDYEWNGNHTWVSLLQPDYASEYALICERYTHYSDAVIKILPDGAPVLTSCQQYYMSINKKVFHPLDMYIHGKGMKIIFNSGCTKIVTPYEEDFVGEIKQVSKTV